VEGKIIDRGRRETQSRRPRRNHRQKERGIGGATEEKNKEGEENRVRSAVRICRKPVYESKGYEKSSILLSEGRIGAKGGAEKEIAFGKKG